MAQLVSCDGTVSVSEVARVARPLNGDHLRQEKGPIAFPMKLQ